MVLKTGIGRTRPRRVLTDDGSMVFGKYTDYSVQYVARNDSDYLQWMLDTIEDMDDQDRDVLVACVRAYGRG